MNKQLLERLQNSIVEGDEAEAIKIADEIKEGTPLLDNAVEVAVETIRDLGERFDSGEVFLPQLVVAGDAMQAFMKIVGPKLGKDEKKMMVSGKIILGTVKGDIHAIGKDIVATMLTVSGCEVVDMGVDVSPMDMIQTAEQSNAKIIALSSLMTTSMPYMKEVIDLLNEMNTRDDFFVIVGGGPVSEEYARRIGANGWAPNATGAVSVAAELLAKGGKPSSSTFIKKEN